MRHKLLVLMVAMVLVPTLVYGQYFGKNQVQYTDFDWHFLQTEHFDIYFYRGGERIADFVADVVESSYVALKEDLRYELTDRISIIVYKSHNDFEQTNVALSPPEESLGGFTEFFKNRVVIPYEGNYEQLRHVVHHELTHAVMLQMVYGAGTQSIIAGMVRFQIPLWLAEGLAEYESLGWNTESDMFLRDATINEYLPEIESLGGFMAYKGGQSVLYYLAEKYGGEKIGEILGKIKINKSVDKGLKQAIGVGVKELSKRWHKYVKKEYWPDIANREVPEDFAKKLTDHTKYRNFVNNSPALSPKGDKIAFLSDKSDYFDIYLMSAFDGKILDRLVKGQRTMNLEELHWLRSGISWSPDGKKIAFAAKSGEKDALHILDVRAKKIIKSYQFNLDGIFSSAWSPTGTEIAFVGLRNGYSDIYSLDLLSGKIRKITDDVFSDLEPSWSPDARFIAFRSDRGEFTDPKTIPANLKIQNIDYRNFDIYVVNSEGSQMQRVTATPYLERYPLWSPEGDKLAYLSDKNGIFNIFIKDLNSGEDYPITNVITGIFQVSWVGNKMVFTSFHNGGYDLYLLKNPLEVKPGQIVLENTDYVKKLKERGTVAYGAKKKKQKKIEEEAGKQLDFKNFIFGERFKEGIVELPKEKPKMTFLDTSQYKLASGEYKIHKYKIKFSPDIVYGNAGYSQFYGLQGQTAFRLSDVLGNHVIIIYSNLFYDLRNSDYQVSYYYLPRRIDVGVSGFHNALFFQTRYGSIVRDRIYGFSAYFSRPFNKFRRIDLSLTPITINRRDLDWDLLLYQQSVLLTSLDLVHDTVIWGMTGPTNGCRWNLAFTYSPYLWKRSLEFKTLTLDWRNYLKAKKDFTFVVRLAGGFSFGKDPQRFFLGGMDNWINYHFKGGLRIEDVEDIYFSSFETPLRGYDYYEKIGTRFFLTNLEFRFPLIRYFLLGWPLPINFQNIRGALFWDIGSAWEDNKEFRAITTTSTGEYQLKDILTAFGLGARANLGFLLLRLDIAWSTNFTYFSRPRYYWSLGAEF